MPALSMACSAAAIAVVLFFLKPYVQLEQQVLAALIDEQVNKRVHQLAQEMNTQANTLVSLRLREFAAEQ